MEVSWRVVNLTSHALHPQERHPIPFELEAGWASEPVSAFSRREKYYAPTEIWTPGFPDCNLVSMLATLSRFG